MARGGRGKQRHSIKMALQSLLTQEGFHKQEIADEAGELVKALSMAMRRASLAFHVYLTLMVHHGLEAYIAEVFMAQPLGRLDVMPIPMLFLSMPWGHAALLCGRDTLMPTCTSCVPLFAKCVQLGRTCYTHL